MAFVSVSGYNQKRAILELNIQNCMYVHLIVLQSQMQTEETLEAATAISKPTANSKTAFNL